MPSLTAFALPSLVTLVAILLYFAITANVGRLRVKHKIVAPAVAGHPEFECAYRVQINTLEQMLPFLPALWIYAAYVSVTWSAALGALWIVGRALYALGYYRAAEKRGAGFGIGMLAFVVLWLGATWGVLRTL